MMSTIRNRQKNWIGHILRGNSVMKIALEGRMRARKWQVDRKGCCWFGCLIKTVSGNIKM